MTQLIHRLTRRHATVSVVLTGLAVVSSILFSAGCFVISSSSNTGKKTSSTTDTSPPVSSITTPTAGATVVTGTIVNITGTASDAGGGRVASVSVSVDGGATWNAATGTDAWSYNWTPTSPGPATIRSRAVDDNENTQTNQTQINVIVISPPQVVSVTPGAGATNVSIGVAPTARFSKPLDITSLNASTVLLRDAANNPVPLTISYRASDFTITLTPQRLLKLGQAYTVTLKGGPAAPHIIDGAGTPLPSDFAWSFTTKPPTPVTIWAPTATPTNPLTNDGNAVELGLKFRSDSDGFITGVRFYKGGPANGGTHVGHLWTSAGTLLGSVNFANETASGWQQAPFQNSIPVTANTTYVVSYFAPQGH